MIDVDEDAINIQSPFFVFQHVFKLMFCQSLQFPRIVFNTQLSKLITEVRCYNKNSATVVSQTFQLFPIKNFTFDLNFFTKTTEFLIC